MIGIFMREEDQDTDSRETVLWGLNEKVAICKPKRQVSEEIKPADILFFFHLFIYFIYLATLGLSCGKACMILVPQPGIEPVSPALQHGFLTTGSPGKSPCWHFDLGLLTSWTVRK